MSESKKNVPDVDPLDIDPSEYEGELLEVCYSYRKTTRTFVPSEVIDTNDDSVIAEWIAKWEDDADDIEIRSY